MSFVFDLDEFLSQAGYNLPRIDSKSIECGSYSAFYSEKSGGMRSFVHRCNDFRECSLCMAHRKRELLERIEATVKHAGNKFFYEVEVDENQYRIIRDNFGTENIIRCPLDNGKIGVLVVAEEQRVTAKFPVAVRLQISDLRDNDEYLTYLCFTPQGKRISGGYKTPVVEEPGEYIEVERAVFHLGKNKQLVIQLGKMAFDRTSYLNPTPETLQDALKERERAFIDAAQEIGLQLELIAGRQKVRVNVKDINWKSVYHYQIE